MPLAKLFVEGTLEIQVLTPILQGCPVPQQGGSKNALKPRAFNERLENRVAAGYLRDRDFDFDPPPDLTSPTVDSRDGQTPYGWRWCRHEIENYLLEPKIVSAAMARPVPEVEAALCRSGARIRTYEAGRWTIGRARRALPPHYELRTRPDGLNDIGLPSALDEATVQTWALANVKAHADVITTAIDAVTVTSSFTAFLNQFSESFVADSANVLIWFSGKDLLAGMTEWMNQYGVANPGTLRGLIRDWIIANPVRTLELLPEWSNLLRSLRAD